MTLRTIARRKVFWIALLLIAGAVGYRLSRTAEFIARYGSDGARVNLCRAIPSLNANRQLALLTRLLQDPVEDVRLAAITACDRGMPDTALDDRLETVVMSPAVSGIERSKAGEVLLGRPTVRPSLLEFLKSHQTDAAFRAACPRLAVAYTGRTLATATLEDRQELVRCCLNDGDPASESMQQLALEHPATFLPWRARFVEYASANSSAPLRQFCASINSAMEALSQHDTDNEPAPAVDDASAPDYTVYPAAWIQNLRPNYQIGTFNGEQCLMLEEGAGGVMSWLKAADGTVDVGEGRFTIFAPRDGAYRLWARVWFDDKCGNSFGIWIDDDRFENFPDGSNLMRQWHWLPLDNDSRTLHLTKGFHKGRLQAWEDGVYIARFALLPEGIDPGTTETKAAVHWDTSVPSSLSFSLPCQSQMRGTTQEVTVWLRRSSPKLTSGSVHLQVPAPFVIDSDADKIVRFADGDPLASATFQISLPADAVVGEGTMRAVFTDISGRNISGEMILGGQFDWLSTGPLEPRGPMDRRLSVLTEVSDDVLTANWSRYPLKGLDRYRRLNFEYAYGAISDKYIYLSADLRAEESGDFVALLTADDTARVYIDGKLLVDQPGGGPGEGRLVMTPFHLEAGQHRLFARVYQSAAANPDGEDRYRHTWNHCAFKLLLRKKRHEAAESIKGLPHADEK